jgi:hypothetical protein
VFSTWIIQREGAKSAKKKLLGQNFHRTRRIPRRHKLAGLTNRIPFDFLRVFAPSRLI